MARQQSDLTSAETVIVHRLVAQTSRAFFDPPYVIVLDRMLKQEVWLEAALTDAVGLGQSKKDLARFLTGLHNQRLVKRFRNTELLDRENVDEVPRWARPAKPPPAALGRSNAPNLTPDGAPPAEPRPRPQRTTMQRTYWYLDYWDFAQVVKYRLGMMRKRIEGGVKQEVTKQDYKCPTCGKSFNALDVAGLMQGLATSSMDPNGEFSLNCDVCASPIDQKMNDEEVRMENDKVHRFNVATEHIRTTLQQVDRLNLEKFDVQAWLMRHVPQTVIVERDENNRPIKSDRPRHLGVNGGISVEVADEEQERLRKLERERLVEEQRTANTLPMWHTHSTVSGAQTALGMSHEERNAKSAETMKRLEAEAAGKANGAEEDADLAAYYASLNDADGDATGSATAAAAGSVSEEQDVKTAASGSSNNLAAVKDDPATHHQQQDADDDEDDEEMEEATGDAATTARKSRREDVLVSVAGQMIPISQVDSAKSEEMTPDEYLAYWRLLDDGDEE